MRASTLAWHTLLESWLHLWVAQHVENEWKVRLDTTDARLDKCARELVSSLQDECTQNDYGGCCTLIELNSYGDTRMNSTLIVMSTIVWSKEDMPA